MKGPSRRGKFAVGRIWECPACHRQVWTGGDVVNLRCDCRAQEQPPQFTWMKLTEERPQPFRRPTGGSPT